MTQNIRFWLKREDVGKKLLNDPRIFIEYSAYMENVYNNINDYNLNRKRNILFGFDGTISNNKNKTFQTIIKELFIRNRKLNIYLTFITQYYFSILKEISLNSTHYLIKKIQTKQSYGKLLLII